MCKRAVRRAAELGLVDLVAYRTYLEQHPDEWRVLDRLTCITISRFYRDKGVFGFLEREVLPRLAVEAIEAGRTRIDAWSAGCASGEEPFTLAIIWRLGTGPRFPELDLRILATDIDQAVLARARRACYRASSLKELPPDRLRTAFVPHDDEYCLRPEYRRAVEVRHHDVRTGVPDGPFDLLLCRNLAFTYFEPVLQRRVCGHLVDSLRPGAALVIGTHEALPERGLGLDPWPGSRGIYRRSTKAPGAG